MNIYELSNKEIREELKRFGNTNYGKVVFLLAYSIPFVLFISTITLLVIIFLCSCTECLKIFNMQLLLLALIGSILITFVLGSIYFYHELKEFINHYEKDKKTPKNSKKNIK